MASRIRLIWWRWLIRIHNQLHQASDYANYSRPHVAVHTSSDEEENVIYNAV